MQAACLMSRPQSSWRLKASRTWRPQSCGTFSLLCLFYFWVASIRVTGFSLQCDFFIQISVGIIISPFTDTIRPHWWAIIPFANIKAETRNFETGGSHCLMPDLTSHINGHQSSCHGFIHCYLVSKYITYPPPRWIFFTLFFSYQQERSLMDTTTLRYFAVELYINFLDAS